MRKTRQITVGNVKIGGGAPVSLQSMTNTETGDAEATLLQINELAQAGCEIVRCAVPNAVVLDSFERICELSPLPVVADIHFDPKLAIAALERGAACIRVNPGNLRGGEPAIREVARTAGKMARPVRIGVNGGSLSQEKLARFGRTPEALVESALEYINIFEEEGCHALKVSLKASSVTITTQACRLFAAQSDIPLHLGITEAGPASVGIIKSAVGIGSLLLDGIGETMRVSLTAPPIEEIRAGRRILEACGLRKAHPEIISCPTCGRTHFNLMGLVAQVEDAIARLHAEGTPIIVDKVAVMGCEVNGPGEASDADVGIAGTRNGGILFKKGVKTATLTEEEILPRLIREMTQEK